MNRNQLKLIACLSMLIDHIGLILFPEIAVLRLIGRIAMPVFAFFIGEGCRYTKNKKAYFLRVFLLGLVCQAVYVVEAALYGGNGFYLNILLTFSVSIPLCYLFLYIDKQLETSKISKYRSVAITFSLLLCAFAAEKMLIVLFDTVFDTNLIFDYGFTGMCLPLFALLSRDKRNKLLSFAFGLAIFCCMNYQSNPAWALSALVSLPLLWLYNGKGGERDLKYFFYAFYPLHLVAVYAVDMVI